MPIQTGDNKFGVAEWIVDPVLGKGTHTTITSAYASASSGDTIVVRPGTYTEDPIVKAGVNLVGFVGDSLVPTVILNGKFSFSAAGTASVSNIRLQTNGDFAVEVSGSSASLLRINNCYLNGVNNTVVSYTSSSPSSGITYYNCDGNLATTGIAYMSGSGAGIVSFIDTYYSNSGNSTTASTFSAGIIQAYSCNFNAPISTSGTSGIILVDCQMGANNATNLTVGGSGTSSCSNVSFTSGTASGVSISSTLTMRNSCSVASSNTNAITGSGTLIYSPITFNSSSSTVNTSTQTRLIIGPVIRTPAITFDNTNVLSNYVNSTAFTPAIAFGGGTTGITYGGSTNGRYSRIGNMVFVSITIVLTNKGSSTGNLTITGLPIASTASMPEPIMKCAFANITLTANYTDMYAQKTASVTTMSVGAIGSGQTIIAVTDAMLANNSQIYLEGFYFT